MRNRKWRHVMSWAILIIGVTLFMFGYYHELLGVMVAAVICICSSIVSICN